MTLEDYTKKHTRTAIAYIRKGSRSANHESIFSYSQGVHLFQSMKRKVLTTQMQCRGLHFYPYSHSSNSGADTVALRISSLQTLFLLFKSDHRL
ncbi:hypothetical protein Nepgr_005513 [Nepenthes gracilis]|uniref:Uncharacterized protein n=1 Tax=Nepenthes gracilis TaxID=150966 RepID=A0AAD3XGE7_NEPGR|nr:hypothetical protein Nepgr_005513 [Nepenthes gracilis]